MCLSIKRFSIIRYAFKDIPCIKVVSKNKEEGILQTAYRNVTIKIGETVKSKIIRRYKYSTIEKAIHSFSINSDISYTKNDCDNPVVIDCIIPKGSFYYVGEFYGEISYASNKLKYLKIKE